MSNNAKSYVLCNFGQSTVRIALRTVVINYKGQFDCSQKRLHFEKLKLR